MESEKRRAWSEGISKIIGHEFRVLDKGFVRVVDYMGNDSSVVQAARVSYGIGTKTPSADETLIRYLLRHRHTTPFEMCQIKFHIKAPIFVARQWIRHRTSSTNEYSARYSELDNEFYLPWTHNMRVQSKKNKQGGGAAMHVKESTEIIRAMEDQNEEVYDTYQCLLQADLSREQARMVLPTSIYTQWYWSVNLWNLMHFLKLRTDPHAQYEIRSYAETISNNIVCPWVPMCWHAYDDYVKQGVTLSSMELDVLQRILNGESIPKDSIGMSTREVNEFQEKIDYDISDHCR